MRNRNVGDIVLVDQYVGKRISEKEGLKDISNQIIVEDFHILLAKEGE